MSISFRRAAKRLGERCLRSLVAPIRLRSLRHSALVLAYHNVAPDGWPAGGDLPQHLSRSDFVAQLDVLQTTHDVVPLRDLLRAPALAQARPQAAITFDDAYRGAIIVGLPEMARRGLPATVFVTPAFVGGGAFWWDELAVPGRGLDPALRALALGKLAGDDNAVRTWAARRDVPTQPAAREARVSSIEELEVATREGDVTIAAHSWSHPSLTGVDDERLGRELTAPLAWLHQHFEAHMAPLLAYPYGHFDARVTRAAAAAGYQAAFAIDGGWLPRPIDAPLAIPRVDVPAGISTDGFALRAAGLFT